MSVPSDLLHLAKLSSPFKLEFRQFLKQNRGDKSSQSHGQSGPTQVHYRVPEKGLQILLSRTQAGTGRKAKQEKEETSRNRLQAFSRASVYPARLELNSEKKTSKLSLDSILQMSHMQTINSLLS